MAPMTDVRIHVEEKAFPASGRQGEHIAIRNLRLSIGSGEFVCLVGPSGCGKTTLLNIIAGLDRDFEGEIVPNPDDHALTIGYVFQNPRLLPWRTVWENIELAQRSGKNAVPIAPLLVSMGLAHVQHQYPERLSLGMRRRVALARAFAIQPELMLMDEPFISLDAPTARRLRRLLISLWQERPHSVLFVTHDLREAITLADRLLFLAPPPTRVINDVAIGIPRARRADEAEIESFRKRLIEDYPELKSLL
jgi:ABC-type nitrate/sulfonate/bicarbonate transport system ATPase subunit